MVVLNSRTRRRDTRDRGVFRQLGCALAGHRPGPDAVANRGYYFAHCARCGVPIMRAVVGGWQTPPAGYRIVWPEQREDRALAAAGPRSVGDGDFMTDGAAAPPPQRGTTIVFGDFMAEDSENSPSRPPRRRQAR